MPNITITVLATYLCRTRLLAVYKIDVVLELMVSQKGDGVYRTWSRSWNWMRGGGAGNSTRRFPLPGPCGGGDGATPLQAADGQAPCLSAQT